MIDYVNETPVAIQDAPKIVPGRPHVSTLYRWAGRHRNPLETFRVGGKTFTTREAIERFIARCSGADPDRTPSTSRRREGEIAAAEHELDEAGIR